MIIQRYKRRYKRRADPRSYTEQSKVISSDALPGEQPRGPFPSEVPVHPDVRGYEDVSVYKATHAAQEVSAGNPEPTSRRDPESRLS